jgi:hypothetical protein
MLITEHKLHNNICMHCTGMSDYFDPMFVLHFELSLRCFSSTVVMQLIAYLCSTITKESQAIHGSSSNISAISWRPVLVVEEAGVPGENLRPWASNCGRLAHTKVDIYLRFVV